MSNKKQNQILPVTIEKTKLLLSEKQSMVPLDKGLHE